MIYTDKRNAIATVADFMNDHSDETITISLKTELIDRLRDLPEINYDLFFDINHTED